MSIQTLEPYGFVVDPFDDDFAEVTLRAVQETDDKMAYMVTYEEPGTSFLFQRTRDDLPAPKVGDQVRVYGGAELGCTPHGIVVNGDVWWYRNAEQTRIRNEYHHAMLRAQGDRDRFNYQLKDKDHLAAINAMHPALRDRMLRYREEAKDRPQESFMGEGYEMFGCQQADALVKHFADGANGGYEVMKRRYENKEDHEDGNFRDVEGFDADAHSGNTYHSSVHLAYAVLTGGQV